MKKQHWIAGAAFAVVLGSAGLAQATTSLVLDLTTADPAAGFGKPAADGYGTVTITDLAGGKLGFNITLDDGASFNVNGNSQHHAFTFDLKGAGVTISNLTSGFSVAKLSKNATTFDQPPFGDNWLSAISYTGSAKQGNAGSSLSFVVDDTLHDLTTASLQLGDTYGGKKIYASADIFQNGATGNVGATMTGGVPEPATWAMMLVGFGGLGVAMRRARRQRVLTA
jgi:hypothetical protein